MWRKAVYLSLSCMAVIVLTGCAQGMARVRAAGSPVVQASSLKGGAFGKDVRRVQEPHLITRGSEGECWDYVVSANGATQAYYVVVGADDRVGSHAFRSCDEAKKRGEFR